jgi:DNA-binding beta-propeller fold protein YncE
VARTVSIYDLASQTIEATIALPFTPDAVVLSPDGLVLAATDRAAGKVGIIHLTDRSVKAVVDGFDRPANIAFSNDSGYVFVTLGSAGQVGVIDAYSGFRLDPVAMSLIAPAASDPEGTAISAVTRTPNGLYGLAADRLSGAVSVINFRDWRESTT